MIKRLSHNTEKREQVSKATELKTKRLELAKLGTTHRIHQKFIGFFFIVTGAGLLLYGLAYHTHDSGPNYGALTGALLLAFGLRLSAKTVQEVIESDQSPPILYLRSFSRERLRQIFELLKCFTLLVLGRPDEKIFAEVFRPIGPMVAIGRPGEWLPPLGAARMYVFEHGDWQHTVTELMKNSSLVLLEVDDAEGVWWEATQAITVVQPQQIIFYFPRRGWGWGKKKVYRIFQEKVGPHLPKPLPEKLGTANFLWFKSDGTPIILERIQRPILGLPGSGVDEGRLKRALSPVLERMGKK